MGSKKFRKVASKHSNLEGMGSMFLWKVGIYQSDYMELQLGGGRKTHTHTHRENLKFYTTSKQFGTVLHSQYRLRSWSLGLTDTRINVKEAQQKHVSHLHNIFS
jgi:hypothetical protein